MRRAMAAPPHPGLTFFGHSTVLVDLGGVRVLTDPVLRDRIGPLDRQGRPPHPEAYEGVDAVVISHLHRDHLDLASLRHLHHRPLIVVPRGAGDLMRRHGFHEVAEVGVGDAVELDGVRLVATPALHNGFRPPFGPNADSLGYVIEDDRRRVYFAGDTDIFPRMSDLAGIDVALLPVWGWGPTLGRGHLDPVRAAEALTLLRPRAAVPIHWGTLWPRGLGRVRPKQLVEPPRRFAALAAERAPDVVVVPTMPGHAVELPR
jgi:L-ascorbate metabolism protein UlaG (beta-lactamase superfamily)